MSRDIWDVELVFIFSPHTSKCFFCDSVRLSIALSFGVSFFINMNPMKLINMDDSMKGMMFLLNHSRMLLDVVSIVINHRKVISLWSFFLTGLRFLRALRLIQFSEILQFLNILKTR